MNCIDLNGRWDGVCYNEKGTIQFAFVGTVPGCVHTDLLGKKIDSDIYYRDNLDRAQWIENKNWKYTRHFRVDEVPNKAKLVFEGLDTYADIYINDCLIGSTDDMFIEHKFNIAENLKVGDNTINVYFHSPIAMVEDEPELIGAFTTERLHTRRIQCTYGWDWVGRFVTCGIFKNVYIDLNDELTVDNAYIYTENVGGGIAQIGVEVEFENFEKGDKAYLEIISPDGEVAYEHTYFIREKTLKTLIDIENVKLWYPVGYGEQPLYILKLCGKEFKFGIRSVRVLQIKDKKDSEYYNKSLALQKTKSGEKYDKNEDFSGFLLTVNDLPIMCKGGNWVPSEPFPSAETPEKITTILELGVNAGLNMLRVWGGGIFEQEHFYNECDRLGILITQDFLMACGAYPENEEWFITALNKEVEFAAKTLRNHPCLMWWSGDNENAVAGSDDMENYTGRTAINLGIAPVLMRLDPRRRFFASSPYGGKPYASKTVGTSHNTNFLFYNYFPYINETDDLSDYKDFLKEFLARFIAEEPVFGAVCLPTLKKIMTDDDIYNKDDMWLVHTKDNPVVPVPGFYFLCNFAKKVLGEFANGYDRLFKIKYIQYEWVRVTMENIRRNRGYCNGLIYWMWNDCWPAASGWSFIDYYCLPKASYYAFKQFADKIIISIDKEDDNYKIYLCNDNNSSAFGDLIVYVVDKNGYSRLEKITVAGDPAASSLVRTIPAAMVPENGILVADIVHENGRNRAFYKNGALPLVKTNALRVTEKEDGFISVIAEDYVHAVELEGEYIFEDNYFSLMPGEARRIHFTKSKDHKNDELTVNAYTVEL